MALDADQSRRRRMRVISKARLREFWDAPGHKNAEGALQAWHTHVSNRSVSCVLYDNRGKHESATHRPGENYSGHHLYIKQGMGAFSLSTMTKVKSLAEAKAIIMREGFAK
jgi:hypothetical protein